MKRFFVIAFGLFGFFLLLPAASDAASPLEAAAQIIDLRGQVTVLPGNGSPHRKAQVYDYLKAGDKLVVTGDASFATILLPGVAHSKTITSLSPAYVVSGLASQFDGASLFEKLGRLTSLFQQQPRSISYVAAGRGSGEDGNSSCSASNVTAPAFIPEGRQYFPTTIDAVTLIWRGRATAVRLKHKGGMPILSRPASDTNIVSLPLAGLPDNEFGVDIVQGGERKFHYDLVKVTQDKIPSPPWLGDAKNPDDNELTEVVRSLWLSTEGPPEWRLYGFARLEQLQASNFAASRVYSAALSCELDDLGGADE